jgi:hypothetical protein
MRTDAKICNFAVVAEEEEETESSDIDTEATEIEI